MLKRQRTSRRTPGSRLPPEGVVEAVEKIQQFVEPYAELMKTDAQAQNLLDMVLGLTSDLERKSIEPIANRAGVHRRILQGFVGINHWEDDPLRRLQRQEVEREIGSEDAALILDGSSVPKQGKKTVGVKRQWSGHEGKVDNCVTGVHAIFAGKDDAACVVDSQLYLPEEWTDDGERRELVHIPDDVEYATIPEIALKMAQQLAAQLRYTWVLADTEFGRSQAFRAGVRAAGKSFAVEVPKDTQVARLRMDVTVHRTTDSVENWGRQIRRSRFKDVFIKYGEKQPLTASAAAIPVWTRELDTAHHDVLLVLQRPDETAPHYFLIHAPAGTSLEKMVRMASRRHRCEEVFEECKGEVGMDHFEVRAFHGWHHHMTLMAMSHWFLVRLKRELGAKYRPGITVSMVRQLISKILAPLATPEYMADWANRQMDRNDEVRDAHYQARGFPPISRSQ